MCPHHRVCVLLTANKQCLIRPSCEQIYDNVPVPASLKGILIVYFQSLHVFKSRVTHVRMPQCGHLIDALVFQHKYVSLKAPFQSL